VSTPGGGLTREDLGLRRQPDHAGGEQEGEDHPEEHLIGGQHHSLTLDERVKLAERLGRREALVHKRCLGLRGVVQAAGDIRMVASSSVVPKGQYDRP